MVSRIIFLCGALGGGVDFLGMFSGEIYREISGSGS